MWGALQPPEAAEVVAAVQHAVRNSPTLRAADATVTDLSMYYILRQTLTAAQLQWCGVRIEVRKGKN